MLLQPGIERRSGVGKPEIRPALHQLQSRAKGPLRRSPSIRDGPKPGQIQMGMAEPMHRPLAQRLRHQLLRNSLERRITLGIDLLPGLWQVTSCFEVQLQGLRQQRSSRILTGTAGFEIQPTADQRPVIMQGTAELQLNPELTSGQENLRQRPATGGVKQIALMHQEAIHPEARHLRPPAETQPNPVMTCIRPGLRPNHGLLESQPLTPPRPDQ